VNPAEEGESPFLGRFYPSAGSIEESLRMGSITKRPESTLMDTIAPRSKPACSSTQRPSTRMQGCP
jgi:hypothetical protein